MQLWTGSEDSSEHLNLKWETPWPRWGAGRGAGPPPPFSAARSPTAAPAGAGEGAQDGGTRQAEPPPPPPQQQPEEATAGRGWGSGGVACGGRIPGPGLAHLCPVQGQSGMG